MDIAQALAIYRFSPLTVGWHPGDGSVSKNLIQLRYNGTTLVVTDGEIIGFYASLICYHARLVKVKNVPAGVSERQALSNRTRFSRSRDPIMKYDSLSTLMSPVDVGASLAGLERCRDVPPFPIISGWERSENRLKRLLSCVGMSKLMEWFLLFLDTMASSHAEDRRLARNGGEVRI